MTATLEPKLDLGQNGIDTQSNVAEVSPAALTRALVRERIETGDGRSLSEIVDLILLEGVPDKCAAYILRLGLLDVARNVNQHRRQQTSTGPGSGKWNRVREAVANHPDVFENTWLTASGMKRLGDFTKGDAVWTHQWYVAQARGNAASADKFAKLAKLLPDGKLAHAMPRERVEAIFNG